MWLTRSLAAGPGAAGLSGAPHSSAQPPGVARGLGSCARAPPPADAAPERACELAELERCGLTKRQDSGRRVAGARGSEPADQLSRRPRHRSLSNSDAGTRAGPQGTCPTEPRAPTWRTWDLPAATWGLAGQGLGLSPRAPLSPRRQGGRGETPPPPLHSTGAWTAARSPLPRLPTPGLWAPSLGVPLADRGLSVFWGGVLKPLSESGGQWSTRRIDDKVLCSLIAAPNL